MDLGRLCSFVNVAERGTVAAAAAALGFTPPAISQHVAKLETELGTKLFDRAGRRLRLTAAGHELLPIALDMIQLEKRARWVVEQPSERPHLVVAGFASALATLLIPKLSALAATMTVEVIESEDVAALRELRLGTVDVALTQEYDEMPADRHPGLTFTPIMSDRLRLVLPAGLPAETTIDELGNIPWLVNGTGTRCEEATTRLLRAAGLRPLISGLVADNDTLLALVAVGHGVTIVPELLLSTPRHDLTVASQDLGISRTILAVHRTDMAEAVAPLVGLLGETDVSATARVARRGGTRLTC